MVPQSRSTDKVGDVAEPSESKWQRWRENAAVRLGAQLAVAIVVGLTLTLGLDAVGKGLFGDAQPTGFRLAMRLTVAAAIAAGAFAVRWIFERRAQPVVVRQGAFEFFGGFLVGTALFSSTVALVALAGSVSIQKGGGLVALVYALGFSLAASIVEEVIFRGVLFRILNESWGTVLAIVATALFFGGAHALNDNATMASNLAIALEAGVLLAAIYLLTERLWMVVGVHAAWNFTQGGIFGLAVSGNDAKGMWKTDVTGPTWLTGGAFGLEASWLAVGLCLIAAMMALVIAKKRGRFERPFWTRSGAGE